MTWWNVDDHTSHLEEHRGVFSSTPVQLQQLCPLRSACWNRPDYCIYSTCLENPVPRPPTWSADSVWNFQLTGVQPYLQQCCQYYQPDMSAVSHMPVTDGHGVHQVASDRGQLFVADNRHLTYQQDDMRSDGVTFPVPVPADNRNYWLSDNTGNQAAHNSAVIDKRHDSFVMKPTSTTGVNLISC